MQQMCERLTACGIPLWRSSVFVRTLHPQVMGRRFTWEPGKEVEIGGWIGRTEAEKEIETCRLRLLESGE